MALTDSKTGKIRKTYTVEQLEEQARLMRGYNLVSLSAAGSGHSGGTLSIMDVTTALYLHIANHDPENPDWDDRDRIIWSAGHKAPALYVGLGFAEYFDKDDLVTLRRLGSPFQGHPHWQKLPGVEVSTGSLGQGLSIAIGMAIRAKMDGKNFHVFSINGDGEQQEGQIWEAAMEAGHFKLDNLTSIIDVNRLQIDGWVKDVMSIEPIGAKYESFGWHVIDIDGHDMKQVVDALEQAKQHTGSPTVILARTVKGKGVSFMEDVAGWHGKAPNYDELKKALTELEVIDRIEYDNLLKQAENYQVSVDEKLTAKQPKFSRDYWWNNQENMKVEMDPTRMGFGRALEKHGGDKRVICLGMDISDSITIDQFYKNNPERKDRFISVGIAEQSGTALAAGLAKEGKLPVIGTYGVFSSGRNLDQVRTTVAYGGFDVLIAGAHGGVSVGPDGATHQALEELFAMGGIPGMNVSVPCDSVETLKATAHLLFNESGPKFVRFARAATPIITREDTPFIYGKANVIRFRGERDNFLDAFDTVLASEYRGENEDLSIIACGPMVPEAMRAAWILKNDFNLETRILNVHTIKPLDKEVIARAASDTGVIVTAEEHQVGGLGNLVAAAILEGGGAGSKGVRFGMIGVQDRFGESGAPWELIKEFEVSAEHIAKKAKELLG
ncbi:transketolase [candidate division LCP-89 bacterium B3_LCP]|uniref:Transketolase n=1 Tax=candidate division LCP-89 bacterium B3_LCP TaxID=2012998 RepID=A0A532UZS4_UNCL8|nr:MAG: transketolase [candidate division LCP-89 bacterium B3_LCP]